MDRMLTALSMTSLLPAKARWWSHLTFIFLGQVAHPPTTNFSRTSWLVVTIHVLLSYVVVLFSMTEQNKHTKGLRKHSEAKSAMVNKQYTNRSEHGQRQSIKIVKSSKKTGQVPQKFRKFMKIPWNKCWSKLSNLSYLGSLDETLSIMVPICRISPPSTVWDTFGPCSLSHEDHLPRCGLCIPL